MLDSNVTLTDLSYIVLNIRFNIDTTKEIIMSTNDAITMKALRCGIDNVAIGHCFDVVSALDLVYHDVYKLLLKMIHLLFLGFEEEKEMAFVIVHMRKKKVDHERK
ncbi:uncharacterized protein LOC107637088 [Arachis ipaensis]|uniref:Uncharacterized protein n=1 Tax=Arachis hypogaea TaxID=3818 RepID=A0A444ZMA8_ARAHY|nr:uncharacterized protein LOC107637088 [Arachis ipaensis]XP_025648163.1 uncharacterized protein LOC112743164 [Arachis hypogaea]RYR15294.1 hypothetical protein Ahy_B04g072019 [Arachis hypogaea]